jgi:hypothetical protein
MPHRPDEGQNRDPSVLIKEAFEQPPARGTQFNLPMD